METIEEIWKRMNRYSLCFRWNSGIEPEKISSFARDRRILLPEDYISFMEKTNGASLFDGDWEILQISAGTEKLLPGCHTVEEVNALAQRGAIPYAESVFLYARSNLADFAGFVFDDSEYEVICISPDMDKTWYYHSFTEWLADELNAWAAR